MTEPEPDAFPMIPGAPHGEPLPDLGQIPEEHWKAALRPVSFGGRITARQWFNPTLEQAAELHGVAPATLARMLTTKGVNATLAAARRDGTAQP